MANDCDSCARRRRRDLVAHRPEHGGKSTFLASKCAHRFAGTNGQLCSSDIAHIGIVSQIFSRVGASDDLARGRSTFMVEMVETAAILNQADDRAWSSLMKSVAARRHMMVCPSHGPPWNTCTMSTNRARLFATHYHEMTHLSAKLDGCENATVSVENGKAKSIFLHEVTKAPRTESYGVQVAQLAGLPDTVIASARVVLDAWKKGSAKAVPSKTADRRLAACFQPRRPAPDANQTVASHRHAADIHPDELSPRERLDLHLQTKRGGQT